MRPGEIYLAQFPFGDIPGMKLRPVSVCDVRYLERVVAHA